MSSSINAKALRASLPDVVKRVQKGERFTVIYRSRPAFRIVPLGEADQAPAALAEDSLYKAGPVGASNDARSASEHDDVLYPK